MLSNQGRVLTKARLLRAVWGLAYADESTYLHVYVNRLRRKLSAAAPAIFAGGPDRDGARHRLSHRRPRLSARNATSGNRGLALRSEAQATRPTTYRQSNLSRHKAGGHAVRLDRV